MEPRVLRNTSRDTEREHLNKILRWLASRVTVLEAQVLALGGTVGTPSGIGFSLTADPSNFSLEEIGDNEFFLDIISGGVGANEIDFSTFTTDDIIEGTTNEYFEYYEHTQAAPSDTWTINHNLGYNPTVGLFTVGGVEFLGQVTHTTVNQTIVNLTEALAGTARLV